ncbi:helix-turn-helix transcriptional regulator [Streptococcus vestibularis]|jgi:DNA-binding XRE family transcriptional regulator|uniref:helix-turn-helix transcriptional regulator n=1 Tax=Streptococcus vestibularis TaxID=1343 RepID=UPI0007E32C55|nr:helix-turn-helix domain-containing protein [Streptococcus vestibularis]
MIITCDISEKVKVKRAKSDLTKTDLAKKLGIARSTLLKIEKGDYNAPKRIYQAVMNWLIEDL